MFIKKISILVFLIFGLFFSPYITSAAPENRPDPFADELQNLLVMPNKIVTTTEEGDTIETFVYTGSKNSAGTIKKKDGSIVQFLKSGSSGGGYSYSFTENGNTTTATIDKDGIISGDPTAMKNVTSVANPTTKPDDGKLTIITSEAVPGADCICTVEGESKGKSTCTGPVTSRKYECKVDKGFSGFQGVFAKIIRYVINIVLLLGVLAVVGLGIAWSFAGGDDVKAKSALKTWAINIVIGLLILFMFSYILRFLAPWIYQ